MMVWVQATLIVSTGAFIAYLALRGAFSLLNPDRRTQESSVSTMHWQTMPSGWSKDYGSITGYTIFDGQRYYWWLQRNNKTIIEGPARTLELAQYEVEAAVNEFRREP